MPGTLRFLGLERSAETPLTSFPEAWGRKNQGRRKNPVGKDEWNVLAGSSMAVGQTSIWRGDQGVGKSGHGVSSDVCPWAAEKEEWLSVYLGCRVGQLPKYNREIRFTDSLNCSWKTEELWVTEIIDGPGRKKP